MNQPPDPEANEQAETEIDGPQLEVVMFALQESVRTLEAQTTELQSLRSRAIAQLGFTGAIVSFMLGTILENTSVKGAEFYFWSILLTLAGVSALYFTHRVWKFTSDQWVIKMSSSIIVEDYADGPPTIEGMSTLVGFYEQNKDTNKEILDGRRYDLERATYALAVLLIVLLISMWRLV